MKAKTQKIFAHVGDTDFHCLFLRPLLILLAKQGAVKDIKLHFF